jgi:diguanylate cyclase (GGDEF)-like protein
MKTTSVFSAITAGLAATAGLTVAAAAVCGNRRLRHTLATTRDQLSEVRFEATHDALTGLANRRGIEAGLADLVASGDSFALLVVDLDDFKPVNDTHGHAAGDVVLTETARRLSTLVHPASDLVGRWGGDEFVLLAATSVGSVSMMLARDAVTVLREPFTLEGGVRVQVHASVGWVQVFPGDDLRIAKKSADNALYRAKAAGGNTVREYGPMEAKPVVDERPRSRTRDSHPHRVPSELGVVIAR